LRALGVAVEDNVAPIAAFAIGDRQNMQQLQEALMSEGVFVFHAHYVGTGSEGVIRCSVFSDHTFEDIDTLLDALRRRL
jgi:7-keto-8-aminopelargonate synthetase-like enzyme